MDEHRIVAAVMAELNKVPEGMPVLAAVKEAVRAALAQQPAQAPKTDTWWQVRRSPADEWVTTRNPAAYRELGWDVRPLGEVNAAMKAAAQAAGLTLDVQNAIEEVEGALELCEPENQASFALIKAALLSRAAPSGEPVAWQDASASQPLAGEHVLVAAEFGPNDWRIKIGGIAAETGDWRVIGASWRPSHWAPLPKPPGAAPQPSGGKHE